MDTALPQKFPFILDTDLAKANCTENHVCTSCDTVVLPKFIKNAPSVMALRWRSERLVPYKELLETIKSSFPDVLRLQDRPNDTSKVGTIANASPHYASPTSGEAYRDRQLTTNFEL